MKKKKVVHIIDSLGRGGAETLLVGIIKAMPQFEHIIISLKPLNEFKDDLHGIKIFFLDFKWYHSIPKTVIAVKKIIKSTNAEIVHANLYWSIIVSRLAVPKNVRLINSYHALLYGFEGANYPFYARLLDKLTYRKKFVTLCVSKGVENNIRNHVVIKENVSVLYNYVEDNFFERYRPTYRIDTPIKLVAVGNIKKDKNFQVIIDAFADLTGNERNLLSLDIYGKGPLLESLKQRCQEKNVTSISFKGSISDVASVLPAYDVFIISSTSEGFGIAVAEAMAVGLPVIVSDIPVLKEITCGNAFYFDPDDPLSLSNTIEKLFQNSSSLKELSLQGHKISQAYRKETYMKRLADFYN